METVSWNEVSMDLDRMSHQLQFRAKGFTLSWLLVLRDMIPCEVLSRIARASAWGSPKYSSTKILHPRALEIWERNAAGMATSRRNGRMTPCSRAHSFSCEGRLSSASTRLRFRCRNTVSRRKFKSSHVFTVASGGLKQMQQSSSSHSTPPRVMAVLHFEHWRVRPLHMVHSYISRFRPVSTSLCLASDMQNEHHRLRLRSSISSFPQFHLLMSPAHRRHFRCEPSRVTLANAPHFLTQGTVLLRQERQKKVLRNTIPCSSIRCWVVP
mmetsp:Transcript_11151/g.31299  ORF Transcript_11151/g.31299 Transcript_11151/m.31299 type:complete len:268 (-) Transcript_11151:415-1218(-)